MNVLLRPLAEADLESVRALRNANREQFFSTGEIDAEQQREWFTTLAMQPVRFYVLEEDGAVVGTVSVTERADGLEVGNLLLADAYRGRGLMTQAVAEVTAAPGRYYALVKPDNDLSLRLFERAGFAPTAVRLEREVE